MVFRPLAVSCLILTVAPVGVGQTDPLAPPQELRDFAFRTTSNPIGVPAKLQGLLSAIFRPVAEGGLGITYDNERTRTVPEVWRDRKANCLSMTAFFVAACRAVGLEAKYAEALNTNRWRKVGNVVRFERHVVSVSRILPRDDQVADFLPNLRRRTGFYVVAVLTDLRFRALFHSNRAVELLAEGLPEQALAEAQKSLEVDPKGSVGWNILGVVRNALHGPEEAEKAFRTALELDPKDSAAIGNMESLLRSDGRVAEAAKYRELGEEVRKKDPYFNAYIADEALGTGDLEEAQRRIQIALKILPHESEFYLFRAKLKLTQGKLDDAVKDIEQARHWADPVERERLDGKLALIKEQNDPKK
jgi:Flp pilus assembly protein TadD